MKGWVYYANHSVYVFQFNSNTADNVIKQN